MNGEVSSAPLRTCFLAAVLAGSMVLAGVAQAAPPKRIAVRYDISRNGIAMAEVSEILEHDGRGYRIESKVRGKGPLALFTSGSVSRSSSGMVGAEGIRPLEFRDQRGERQPELVHFDWTRREAVQQHEGRSQSVPIVDDMRDRLSFAWEFVFAPPKAAEVAATIVDGRGTTRYRYTVAGKETLKTAAGDIEALRLIKQREGGDDRGTEIWLAVNRHYVPARILVIEKDGTRLDQVVTSIEP